MQSAVTARSIKPIILKMSISGGYAIPNGHPRKDTTEKISLGIPSTSTIVNRVLSILLDEPFLSAKTAKTAIRVGSQ